MLGEPLEPCPLLAIYINTCLMVAHDPRNRQTLHDVYQPSRLHAYGTVGNSCLTFKYFRSLRESRVRHAADQPWSSRGSVWDPEAVRGRAEFAQAEEDQGYNESTCTRKKKKNCRRESAAVQPRSMQPCPPALPGQLLSTARVCVSLTRCSLFRPGPDFAAVIKRSYIRGGGGDITGR